MRRAKLYEKDIKITVKPYASLFPWGPRWKAETGLVERPYNSGNWGIAECLTTFGKTAQAAVEEMRDKLCKITAREEERHARHLEWEAGIKETTFNRDQDCNPAVPRSTF